MMANKKLDLNKILKSFEYYFFNSSEEISNQEQFKLKQYKEEYEILFQLIKNNQKQFWNSICTVMKNKNWGNYLMDYKNEMMSYLPDNFEEFLEKRDVYDENDYYWKEDFEKMICLVIKNFVSNIKIKQLLSVEYEISIIEKIKIDAKKDNDIVVLKNEINRLETLWKLNKYSEIFLVSNDTSKKLLNIIFQKNNKEVKKVDIKSKVKEYNKPVKEYLNKISNHNFNTINANIATFLTQVVIPIRNSFKPEKIEDNKIKKEFEAMSDKSKRLYTRLHIDNCKTFMNLFLLDYKNEE